LEQIAAASIILLTGYELVEGALTVKREYVSYIGKLGGGGHFGKKFTAQY
jgi:hypothetical protein